MSGGKVPLSSVLRSLESGARPKGGVTTEGDVPSLGGEHVGADGRIKTSGVKRVPRTFYDKLKTGRVRPRDILIVKDGATTGKTAYVPEDFEFDEAAINEHVFRLEVDDSRALPKYVAYFLQSGIGQRAILADFRGATVGGISRGFADRALVPLPPLDEQRRIAAMLDKAEELRTKRRAAIALLDQLPHAIFLEMFGDPKSNEMNWPRQPIGDLARIRTGGTPSRTNEANYGGPISWVKTGEVDGQAIRTTEETLTVSGLKNSNCQIFPVGSVVVAMYGQGKTRGRCSILEIEAATNQACAVVLPSDRLSAEFLFAQLSMSYERLRDLGRGGNQPNLNLSLVGGFEVIVPPREEQCRFASRVEAIHRVKAAHQFALAECEALFTSLQHRVFTIGSGETKDAVFAGGSNGRAS